MKKIGFKILSILMMAAVCVGFAACGDDDDEDNGGGGGATGYVSIGGNTYNFSHGYYYLDGNRYFIIFYNYDFARAAKTKEVLRDFVWVTSEKGATVKRSERYGESLGKVRPVSPKGRGKSLFHDIER